jgi:hypothetical protein
MDLEYLGDSECIEAAGYKAGFLVIQFKDGTMYTYESVSPSTWVSLKRSASKGYYFNKYIRNNYSFSYGDSSETGSLKFIDEKYFTEEALEATELI